MIDLEHKINLGCYTFMQCPYCKQVQEIFYGMCNGNVGKIWKEHGN